MNWYKNATFLKTAGGDCFSKNGKIFMDMALFGGRNNLILVHGEVTGQGRLEGVNYGHCWIEDGDYIIDESNGRNIRMPKTDYYKLGRIGDNVVKYDVKEFRRKVLEHEHWRSWDLQTSSGL